MHGHVLSQGLHRGRLGQERLNERAYAYLREEYWYDQQNCGEVSLGELFRGGTRNLIRVDISATRHLGHGGCICRSVEDALGNLFDLSFILKEKNPVTHCRSSK